MRLLHGALLGLLFVLVVFSTTPVVQVGAQSPQIDNARSQLVQAFLLAQQADAAGAPAQQISKIADSLNLALEYQENATRLFGTDNAGSILNAEQSSSLSNATATRALSLEQDSHRQMMVNQIVGYSVALATAFGSSLLVFEIHRFRNFVRELRMRRMRFD